MKPVEVWKRGRKEVWNTSYEIRTETNVEYRTPIEE
jgi:hypothetical protein